MPSTFAVLDQLPEGPPERLDAVDPRLVTLGDLADRGKWPEAAERAQELIDAHIFDVRPLSYLFFARFHRDGLPALGSLYDAVEAMAGVRFAQIGPPKKREHHFDKRLTWLFEKVLETLEYHEHKKTPEWVQWHDGGVDVASIARIVASGDAVAKRLAEISAFEEAPRALGALQAWLRQHSEILAAPPKKKTEPPPPTEMKGAASVGVAEGEEDPAEEAALASLERRVDLIVSYRFTILVSSLRSFESLVAKGEFAKAAIVADEVNRLVASFDPRDYFPDLFAKFSALFSEHVGPLTDRLEQRESPAWKALEQFYRVDPKSFVGG